jgi:rare lipoprotein A
MLYRLFVVSFLCVVVGLSGCSLMSPCYSRTFQDGAPDFNVDAAQIPDAVPRCEVKPRFCNPSSYRVAGKTYHVLKSAAAYCERGVASWYGTKFYKGKTASGETYNVLGMTAAHRTLPIPTYVCVTHLKNGRQAIVKVNDRGPFKSGRIIDLSYVAAKKLGIAGTAPVEVTVVEPDAGALAEQKPLKIKKHKSRKVKRKAVKAHSNNHAARR